MTVMCRDDVVDRMFRRIALDLGDGSTMEKLTRFETVIQEETNRNVFGQKEHQPTLPVSSKGSRLKTTNLFVAVAAIVMGVTLPLTTILYSYLEPSAIVFWVGEDNNSIGVIGQSIETTRGETTSFNFENQSKIELRENSYARVTKSNTDEVVVELDRGEILADVEGAETTRWIIDLKEFKIQVLGTKFYSSWDDKKQLLDVRVEKGIVLVEGEMLGERGVTVPKGSHLRVNGKTNFYARNDMTSLYYGPDEPSLLKGEAPPEPVLTEKQDAADVEKTASSSDSSGKEKSRNQNSAHHGPNTKRFSKASPNNRPIWLQLFDNKQYTEAVGVATFEGLDTILDTSKADALWDLIKAARNIGNHDVAEQALLTYRRRFNHTPKSATAAFVLGKLYYHGRNDEKTALKWFRIYLEEAPTGTMARVARERVILILKKQGSSSAKDEATKYIEEYPDAVFTDTARIIVKQKSAENSVKVPLRSELKGD
jgi:TolA-binding protein